MRSCACATPVTRLNRSNRASSLSAAIALSLLPSAAEAPAPPEPAPPPLDRMPVWAAHDSKINTIRSSTGISMSFPALRAWQVSLRMFLSPTTIKKSPWDAAITVDRSPGLMYCGPAMLGSPSPISERSVCEGEGAAHGEGDTGMSEIKKGGEMREAR